eukprot:Nk52_evm4s290 gene=Nk52_evmTU4s290
MEQEMEKPTPGALLYKYEGSILGLQEKVLNFCEPASDTNGEDSEGAKITQVCQYMMNDILEQLLKSTMARCPPLTGTNPTDDEQEGASLQDIKTKGPVRRSDIPRSVSSISIVHDDNVGIGVSPIRNPIDRPGSGLDDPFPGDDPVVEILPAPGPTHPFQPVTGEVTVPPGLTPGLPVAPIQAPIRRPLPVLIGQPIWEIPGFSSPIASPGLPTGPIRTPFPPFGGCGRGRKPCRIAITHPRWIFANLPRKITPAIESDTGREQNPNRVMSLRQEDEAIPLPGDASDISSVQLQEVKGRVGLGVRKMFDLVHEFDTMQEAMNEEEQNNNCVIDSSPSRRRRRESRAEAQGNRMSAEPVTRAFSRFQKDGKHFVCPRKDIKVQEMCEQLWTPIAGVKKEKVCECLSALHMKLMNLLEGYKATSGSGPKSLDIDEILGGLHISCSNEYKVYISPPWPSNPQPELHKSLTETNS